jgi:hypothetical protein
MTRLTLVAAAALLALGCAPQTKYTWGGYDEVLYAHYKAPQDHEAFVAALKTVIVQSEAHGNSVPPGCYAEYGYALLEEGQSADAIVYFGKERDKWPESRALMDKMVAYAQGKSNAHTGSQRAAPPDIAPPSTAQSLGAATASEGKTP